MHLDETFDVHVKWHFVVRWLYVFQCSLPLGVVRQALHHPSPSTISSTGGSTSEEEGIALQALLLTLWVFP